MRKTFLKSLVGAAVALATASASAQVDHLLLSEIGMNAGPNNQGEYIEIFNPTGAAVDLSNYWLSDVNIYKTLPTDADGLVSTNAVDNVIRFPNGASLASGQVAVIVGDADSFIGSYFNSELDNYLNQPGSPLIFEVGGTTDTVENMRTYSNNAEDPLNWNLTNAGATNGEFMVLFYWDEVSDLVKDVDIVAWGGPSGTANEFVGKKSTDLGKNGTPYLNDAGTHNGNLTVGQVPIAVRISINEGGEVLTGGNGLTGHDESSEVSTVAWVGGLFPADMSPGVTGLTTVLENQTPIVTSVERDIQYPSSTQAVKISIVAEDYDGTIANAEVFVDTGSGFNSVPASAAGADTFEATLMPMASGTLVKYYALVTDNGGATATLPLAGADGAKSFQIDDNPVQPGDVVINEILYDHSGSDIYEFVELRNTLDEPVSLAHFRFADLNRNWFRFPEDAEIPANGFAVVTLGLEEFTDQFGQQPNVQYYDWGTFALNNSAGGDTIYLVHPNAFDFNGVTEYLDIVQYDIVAPWPEGAAGGSGKSMELKNPSLDNNVGENWVVSAPAPTPGLDNTAYSTVLITEFNRDQAFPPPNTPVTVSAKVVSLTAATIQSVTLYVDSGSGFVATPMTLTATPDVYSVQIGGYPQDAIVKYYIQVENSTSDITRLPGLAPADFNVFIVDLDPVSSGDVVINEILYDTFGSDTNSYEFIELYNTTGEAIDLSYFRVMDNQSIPFAFPEGTMIESDAYVVVTMNDTAFRAVYGSLPSLYSWQSRFGLANGGDTVQLIHPNLFTFTGGSIPLESVSYLTTAPWPNWTEETDHPNATGRSIELINPNYQDRYTNGERWDWTTKVVLDDPELQVRGTPGAVNSVFSTSSVTDWSVY